MLSTSHQHLPSHKVNRTRTRLAAACLIWKVGLFAYFGYKLLQESYAMYKDPPKKNEELEEVEEQ